MFHNKNFGNPNVWTYEPDLARQATYDGINRTHVLRLTWQATRRNKFTAYWSEQYSCERCSGGGTATTAPEAQGIFEFRPSRIQQATYSSPISNRLLVEAGYGAYKARYGSGWKTTNGILSSELDNSNNSRLVSAQEQGGIIPGLTYRFPTSFNRQKIRTETWRASMSYVTGAHNMKIGYYGGWLPGGPGQTFPTQEITQYRFNNGVPNQISINGNFGNPPINNTFLLNTGIYAQDSWTHGKWTLQGGVRYDGTRTWFPTLTVGGTRLIPRVITFPSHSTQEHKWNDITPRMAVAYDLFGNGKTALKFHLGKYIEALSSLGDDTTLNPIQRIATSTTRAWTDGNRNLIPECDLTNPDSNGECGPMANRNLGQNTLNRTWDPNYVTGWGKRSYNWELAAQVQQQIVPRVAVTVGYFRRSFGNWYTTQNRALAVSDFTPYYITAPLDPRLPGGGGYQIGPLYNVVPSKFGQIDEFSTASDNLAKQTENWNGFDITANARWAGLTLQGGTSSGRKYANNCALREVNPYVGTNLTLQTAAPVATTINGASPTSPYCDYKEPIRTRTTGLASYVVPKVDVQVSGTWQSNPGLNPVGINDPYLSALWVVPGAVAAQALGRPLSGGAANVTVNLIQPGTLFGPRVNQFDFRVAKILRFGRTRTQVSLDCYNCTNTDTPLTFNQTFVPGGQWLTPTSVMVARFIKLGMQVDF